MIKKGLKIFICEDDPGILEVIGIALKTQGFEPISQSSLDKLEDKILIEKPRILLLDLWLNGTNGEDILKKLKSNDKLRETAIILMSAHAALPDIAKAHGVDFLRKPFALEELWSAIARNSH